MQVTISVCHGTSTRTYTHTLHVWDSYVSPGSGTRHLESLKNPGGLNLGIYVYIYVYQKHVYIYMLGGGMRSWTKCMFFVNISLPQKKSLANLHQNLVGTQRVSNPVTIKNLAVRTWGVFWY